MSLLNNIQRCVNYIDSNNLDEYRVCHTPESPFDDKYKGFGIMRIVKETKETERLTIDEFIEKFGV